MTNLKEFSRAEPLISLPHPNDYAEKSPIHLGIIGLGNIGRQHFRAATSCPAFAVEAVADAHFDETDINLHEVEIYHDWRQLLEHPQLDAVSICVPHHLHAPMTAAALEAGKHVLVEKPLALDCAQGRELMQMAQARDLTLMVELTHRFYPPLREARALVQSGQIGRIYAVEDRIIESVAAQLSPWMQRKSTAGGGVALTNGVHMLDRVAATTGQTLSFCSGVAGFGAGFGDVEDTAAMSLVLENGAPLQILASWPRGEAGGSDDELTIYGTKATLRVWAWRGWRLEPLDGKMPIQEKHCYPSESDIAGRVQIGVSGALEEFAAAVREGRAPHPTVGNALDAQILVEEFYAFTNIANSGRKV